MKICIGKKLSLKLDINYSQEQKNLIEQLQKKYLLFNDKTAEELRIKLQFVNNNRQTPNDFVITEENFGSISFKGFDFSININLKRNTGTGVVNSNIYSFDSLLRTVFSSIAVIKNSGFFLHSAGIVNNSSAILFAGSSGSGKSTIAKNFSIKKNNKILSDEIIPVFYNSERISTSHLSGLAPRPCFAKRGRLQSGVGVMSRSERRCAEFTASSCPFYSEVKPSKNIIAEIKKIFFLGKGEVLRKLNFEEALSEVLKNTMFFLKEKKFTQQLLSLAEKFCQTVPAYIFPRQSNLEDVISTF